MERPDFKTEFIEEVFNVSWKMKCHKTDNETVSRKKLSQNNGWTTWLLELGYFPPTLYSTNKLRVFLQLISSPRYPIFCRGELFIKTLQGIPVYSQTLARKFYRNKYVFYTYSISGRAFEEYLKNEDLEVLVDIYTATGGIPSDCVNDSESEASPLNTKLGIGDYRIQFHSLYLAGSLTDFEFIVESFCLSVHRIVLSAGSSYFRMLFQEDTRLTIRRINVNDLDYIAVHEVVDYLYTGRPPYFQICEESTVLNILKASRRYDIPELLSHCTKYVLSFLNVNNCVKIVKISDELGLLTLKEEIIDYICDNKCHFPNTELDRLLGDKPNLLSDIKEKMESNPS